MHSSAPHYKAENLMEDLLYLPRTAGLCRAARPALSMGGRRVFQPLPGSSGPARFLPPMPH